MYEILIGVIACYGAAVATVHLFWRRASRRPQSESHFILLTRDDETVIEHCLRSLQSHARKSGIPVKITVWDQGSQDGTAEIVRRWNGSIQWVGLERAADGESAVREAEAWRAGSPDAERPGEAGLSAAESMDSPPAGRKADSEPRKGREQILWSLRASGIVSELDQPILIDMKSDEDWSKLPF
ncbi:hypothetical protein B8V81_0552 [Paenibacillus pasadenensis]|uniref:Glycosyltransferase 2-like domain-containing protein n=1 Tax=Paenibacillus pasadenensis TaxID=217090 RepID=A0A2N5NDS5_9BACL|nr:hypothetical protein [Paenibacillus pasadenensis]PLT48420.1 hypothetical protein B8V81_0552 [Paenibacillus pasadenensis]